VAGEACSVDVVRRHREKAGKARLYNEYGPTENTVWASVYEVKEWEEKGNVPIGRGIRGTQLYVVGEGMEPVPVGVAGELYIGGAGVARGYLNRPELTAERFVPDPFVSSHTTGGERLYRTGDLVRWLEDGNLEYLGRQDHQVKIRGFRIELGEIEAALQEYEGVRQAVVTAHSDETGDKRLVAYVVADPGNYESAHENGRAELRINELREHLRGKLPEYMVPGSYVQLEKLPLNHNGKIDRKNLPQPDKEIPEQEYVGPRNSTEEILCRQWEEVLRRERIGIHDNFFKIGGHSLLAAQLATRMRERFQVDIALRRMFEVPTIAQLSELLDHAGQTDAGNSVRPHLLPTIKRQARKAASLPVERIG